MNKGNTLFRHYDLIQYKTYFNVLVMFFNIYKDSTLGFLSKVSDLDKRIIDTKIEICICVRCTFCLE